jgi:sugar transferase (PEP-CTERM/EpsH1 system associated)
LKILLTLPRPLFPADLGGKIRTLNIFSHLAKRVEVHAISLADPDRDAQAIVEMRQIFRSYTPIFWREKAKYSLGFYTGLLVNHLRRLPYSVAKYRLAHYRRAVEALAARERFDLIFCDFLPPAAALLETGLRPRVLFEHNVESLLRKRYWETEQNPVRKWIFHAEWKKVEALEAKLLRSSDYVIAVSEDDRQILQREFGVEHVSSIPTGVDTEFFRPPEAKPCPGRIAFVGSMDWYPNEDGVIWFLQEVYPRLRKENREVNLAVVGRNPSARLLQIAASEPGVEITGRVDDVRPYLAQASVVVVPLRIGGGTRIKIPEAMAMAKPVVSTRLGAEGLPLLPGREILLEDEPEGFALAIGSLLKDAARREAIGIAAREKVVRDHNWEVVALKVEQILKQVIARNAKHEAMEFPVRASEVLSNANE